MIPYQMTPNLMKAELISAMDSINHSNALFGHSNEDSSKKKKNLFLDISYNSSPMKKRHVCETSIITLV